MISIIRCKCPRCKEGNLFCDSNPYHLKKIFEMPKQCSQCGLVFNSEPGFFYGSMYVGYGLSVVYFSAIYVIGMLLFPGFSLGAYFIFCIPTLILLTPLVFRLSRSVWISTFVSYDHFQLRNGKIKSHMNKIYLG